MKRSPWTATERALVHEAPRSGGLRGQAREVMNSALTAWRSVRGDRLRCVLRMASQSERLAAGLYLAVEDLSELEKFILLKGFNESSKNDPLSVLLRQQVTPPKLSMSRFTPSEAAKLLIEVPERFTVDERLELWCVAAPIFTVDPTIIPARATMSERLLVKLLVRHLAARGSTP